MEQDNHQVEWILASIALLIITLIGLGWYYQNYFNNWFLQILGYALFPIQYIPEIIFKVLFFWKYPPFIDLIITPINTIMLEYIPYSISLPISEAITPQSYMRITADRDVGVYPQLVGVLEQIKFNYISLSLSNDIANYIGTLIWPYFLFFYVKIMLAYKGKRKYSEVHTADTILDQEKNIWHTIEPMLNVHPELEKDLEAGPWAMAKRAEHYGPDNNMIITSRTGCSLNFNQAELVFSKQCAAPFKGIDGFKIHERWLYAMFLTKANRDGKTAQVMLDLLNDTHTSRSVPSGIKKQTLTKLNKLADDMINKFADSDVEKIAFKEHYFTVCVLSRMLDEARQDGVLATSNFVWLRPLDRHLWYMLSNTGRGGIKKESGSASFVEVAGPTCHMLSERILKRKISIPDVRQAIIAFDQYWFETNDKYTQYFKDEY
jgi:hypothetical protein